jgi:hypothetical protein
MVDWKQTVIICVVAICCTVVFGIVVTGCHGCMQQDREYRLKYLEQQRK